ncbi:MAG: FtsX-like permease family protein, partial [Planctomycetota bacterium]
LKAVGMTPGQLRATVLCAVGLQATLGIAVGTLAWPWLGGPLMSGLFSGLGLVDFPLRFSLVGALALAPAILAFCLLAGWLPSAKLARIRARGLVIE